MVCLFAVSLQDNASLSGRCCARSHFTFLLNGEQRFPPYSLLGSEISFVEFMEPKEGVPFVSWAPKASDGESFIRSKITNYFGVD
jgi:hypothetical protein